MFFGFPPVRLHVVKSHWRSICPFLSFPSLLCSKIVRKKPIASGLQKSKKPHQHKIPKMLTVQILQEQYLFNSRESFHQVSRIWRDCIARRNRTNVLDEGLEIGSLL